MTITSFLWFVAIVSVVLVVLWLAWWLIGKEVVFLMQYRDRIPLAELLDTLNLMIGTETVRYEEYLGNSTDNDFVALTNSQFENIYSDISLRIIHSIPEHFYRMAGVYMTKDAVQTYIAQSVYNYLAKKVGPPSQVATEENETEDET